MVEPNNSQESADHPRPGLTRREALKKGAVLGGALVWTTPLVQAIGMRPAQAQEVSPVCQVLVTPIPGGDPICLLFPAALCECLADCGPNPTAACVAACFAAHDPIGPC
jgi:hypothetical protein